MLDIFFEIVMFSKSENSEIASQSFGNMTLYKRRVLAVFLFFVLLVAMMMWWESDKRQSSREFLEAALQECLRSKYRDYHVIENNKVDPEPTIYVITPTYARPVQKAELTRLSHTFMLVPNLNWIVVEDAEESSVLITKLLLRSRIPHIQLVAPTPSKWKLKDKDAHWKYPRGVIQRNKALDWLRAHLDPIRDKGVVYFADDDNAYSLEIFEEMRSTKGVSVWPVGLVGGLMVEKPIVNTTTGRVVGWNSFWKPDRPFPIDMAGFAINVELLLRQPEAKFSFEVEGGLQESEILRQITTLEQLEPKADNCTKVYVWHTRTENPKFPGELALRKKGQKSHEGMEV